MLQRGTWVSRLAAVAILVLILLAGYRFLAQPLLERYGANGQRIVEASDLLERYRRLEVEKPALLDRLAALRVRDEAESGYWVDASDVMTAARLQDRVAEAVKGHGGDVTSMQTLDQAAPEEAPAIARTALRMRLATTIEGLARTLHDIETATPYMFIDRLIVTMHRSRQRDGAAAGRKQLDVRLDLAAYTRNEEPVSPERSQPADEDG